MRDNLCALGAVVLLIAFAAVSMFIPYALIVLAMLVGLGFACKVIKRSRNEECKLGFC
jgi:hypothetical protein